MNTGFDKAIRDAENPTHHNFDETLAKRIKMERTIAIALVEAMLERGWKVSMFDGEEWVIINSTVKEDILMAMFTTDSDLLQMTSSTGFKAGWFDLTYGSGYDVISDYSDNELCRQIWDDIAPVIERLGST